VRLLSSTARPGQTAATSSSFANHLTGSLDQYQQDRNGPLTQRQWTIVEEQNARIRIQR